MKSYNLIFLLSLSVLFAFTNAQENSKIVDNQIEAGNLLIEQTIDLFKNSYMGTIHDCFTAKKDVFAYFKERINHRFALNFNASDIIEYQTFTTNMNTSLESAVASISYSFDDLKQIYSTFMAQSNLNVKNILIDAIVPLKYIIDSNITAYNCYMDYFSNMIPMQINKMSTIQKKTYRSLMVSRTAETSEFVMVVQKLIALIEKKLDFCTGKSLDNELCLNNYATHTGQIHLKIVQAYQSDFMTDATALFTESTDIYTTQEEAMLEVISTAKELTMLCAKM